MGIIFPNFETFCNKNLNSPHVKRWLIYSMRNTVYKLSHELPNDFEIASQEIRKFQETIKIRCRQSLVLSLHSRNKNFVIAVKIYAELVIKVFFSCLMLFDFFTLFQIFCPLKCFKVIYRIYKKYEDAPLSCKLRLYVTLINTARK